MYKRERMEGRKEGRKKGRKRGREEGKKEGRKEGRKEEGSTHPYMYQESACIYFLHQQLQTSRARRKLFVP